MLRAGVLAVALLVGAGEARAQFTYSEDFKNATAAGWVLNPAGNSAPAPILTSGATGRTGDPEGAGNPIDPAGAGWLRLTNNTTNEHNAVYFDTPIPSAGNSVNVTFGVNMYGGNNFNGTGADGITFFLYDASKPFVVGASGGSIGYAQKDQGTVGVIDAANDHNGLNGGWVGVSLDAYGNFSVAGEGRIGGTGSLQANSVVVRGPGDGLTGYNYLAGTGNRDYTDTGGATTLDAGDGTVPSLPYTMAFASAADRPNQSTQYRNVSITFDENSQLSVRMQFGEDGLWYDVLNVDLSSFVRPEQLKMGFAAGTGDGTQVYEIGGLLTVTATAGTGNFIWDNGEGAAFKVWGTGANDPLNWAGNTNPTLKANVLFNDTYVTTSQAIDVTGSDKVVKNMYFSGGKAYTLTTSDQRMLIFDSDSVGVPTSINLTNLTGNNADHTIGMNVQMNKNLEVNNNISAANTFTISGNIDTNGNTLTTKGAGVTVLSGAISGTGALVKSDTGTTVLSGASANTYTGTTTISGGILQIEKATALGSTAAGTTVAAGGTLALAGSGTTFAAEGLTINGDGDSSAGALRNYTGNNTWTGTVALGTAGSNSIGVDSGTGLIVSGVISGAAGNNLTKVGAGTLTLAGTNTYGGATTINGGTVKIGADVNLGTAPGAATAGQLTLNGGTLQTTAGFTLNGNRGIALGAGGGTFQTDTGTLTYNGIAAGAGSLTKTGGGTLLLGGVNTYTGATTISAGTLQLGATNALASSTAVTVAGGATFNLANFSDNIASLAGAGSVSLGSATLTVSGTSSTTYSGVMSGTGGLTKTGSSNLTLAGANTYTGSTTIGNGTANAANLVTLGASNVLANSSTLVLNGGTLAVGGDFDDTIGTLTLSANSNIDFGAHDSTLTFGTVNRTGGTLTIDNWAGSAYGGGTSQLVFTNAATGFTVPGAGRMSEVSFTGWGSGAIRLASGEITPYTGGTVYTYALTGNGTWGTDNNWSDGGLAANADPGTFASVAGDTAILGSSATGAAALTLGADRTLGYVIVNNPNKYTINSGNNLIFDVNSASAQFVNQGAGGIDVAAGVKLSDNLIITEAGSGNINVTGAISNQTGNNNLTVTGDGTGVTTLSGVIGTGTGSLTKSGTSTLVLSGAANTYGGGTTITGGTLKFGNDNLLGATSGSLTLNGGTLENSASTTLSATRNVTVNSAGGTFLTDPTTTLTYNGVLAGSGPVNKTGTGTLILGGATANTQTGAINVNAGTLTIAKTAAVSGIGDSAAVSVASGATLSFNGTAGTYSAETIGALSGAGTVNNAMSGALALTVDTGGTDSTFSGLLSNSGGGALALAKTGNGTLTLSGANTYTGATTISNGVLNIRNSAGLGSAAAGTTVADTARLELQGGINIGTEALTLNGTGGAGTNGALRSIAGDNVAGGAITLATASKVQSDAGTLTLSGNITATNQNLIFGGEGNITANGVIGLGTGTLTKNGNGYLILNGSNTYTGATAISAGTLEVRNSSALGNSAGTTTTTVASGATLALSNNVALPAGPGTTTENLSIGGSGVGNNGAIRSLGGTNSIAGTIALTAESYVGVDANTLQASGVISGGFGLTKVGAGTLTLGGTNAYTGTTAISAGTLEITNSAALGTTNATTIADTASFRVNGSGLAVAENFTVTGTGAGAAGAIQNTGGNNTLSGAVTLSGSSVVSATTGTSLTLSGVIGESGGSYNLVKDGAGDLTLGNAANTYTGTTTVRNGSLTVTQNAPAGVNGALGNANSVVQLGDSGSTGPVSLLAGGSGGLTVARQISVNNFGTGTTLGGTNTTGTNTFSGNITLGKDASLTAASGGTVNVSGVIDGTGGLTKTGDGTVVLGGANTYAGATTVAAGTLQVTNAGALGSAAAGTTVTATGGALALSGGLTLSAGESLTLNGTGVSAAGALTNVSDSNTVQGAISLGGATTLGSQSGTLTLAGVISGGSNLSTTGAGNLTFTAANTNSGTLTIGDGTTTLANAGGQAFGSVTGVTVASGATLALGAANQINDAAVLTLAGGTLNVGSFSETMRQLVTTASSTSAINYLDDGSVLRFNGVTGSSAGLSLGASSVLNIDNWAGSLEGGGTEQLIVYSNSGAPVVTGITFTDWGAATTIARTDIGTGYWEIVPTITATYWHSDSATANQTWNNNSGNWSNTSGTTVNQPSATGAIVILGDIQTAGAPAPLANNISINVDGSGASRTIGKLIFENSADKNYTLNSTNGDRLDFNVTSGQAQIIVNDNGAHTINAPLRILDDMLITNNSTVTAGLTITGAVDLRNGTNSDLTVNGSGSTLISGVISNNTAGATLLKTGDGTLSLSGNNTFSGGTTLRDGTLVLNHANATGSAGTITVNDASTTAGMDTSLLIGTDGITVAKAITVGSQGAGTTLGGATTLTLGSDNVTFSGNISLGKTVDLNASGSSLATFSGVLSGAGGVEKIGTGTVILSGGGANTNSGDVRVTAGTLEIQKAVTNGAIADAAAVTVASGATLKFNNGRNETIGSLAGAGTVNNANATAMTLTTGGNDATTTFSGSITDSGGNLTLVKTGTGTMTLSGANSYDGQTNVAAGTLIAASNTALGSAANKTTVATDSTLGLQGNITITGESLDLAAKASPNIASVANLGGINTYTGNVSLTGATAGDDVKLDAATGSQLTLSGIISHATNAKDLAKTGGGTLVLSGANTYGGQTSVAAGTLVVSNDTALGAAAAGTADDTFVQIGATLGFDHATGVTVGSGEDITISTTAAPTAASLKNIAGSNTVQGNVTLSGGVNTGVIIDANSGTLNLAGVVSNGANANFITKTGSGTLTLSGGSANTYGGATNVNDGTLLLNKTAGVNAVGPGALNIGDGIGAAASATVQLSAANQINNATDVTIATDGKLDLQGNSDAIGSLTMNGGSVAATGSGNLTLGGNLTFNGIGTNTAGITANVNLGGDRIVQVGNNGVTGDTDLTINGIVSGTGNSFTKTDLGTLSLTGAANTFTGNFQITDGTVVLDKTAVAGVKGNATGAGNASVTIGDNIRGANTAIMQVNGDGLAAGQTSDQIANTATLTVNSDGKFLLARTTGTVTDGFTETIGALAGSGNVDLGYYTLVAGGNNADTAFAGTLVGQSTSLFEKAGSGTLTIDSDLGFAGTVNLTGGTLAFDVDNAFNTVNVAAGTTLRLSDADLSIANLNFTGTGTITLDFAGSASLLNVTNLNVGSGITLNIINWQNAVDYFYAANWTGAVVDVRGVAPENQVIFNSPTYNGGNTIWQNYDHQITPVPEPSTYGALLLGAMSALLGYRRYRKPKPAARA